MISSSSSSKRKISLIVELKGHRLIKESWFTHGGGVGFLNHQETKQINQFCHGMIRFCLRWLNFEHNFRKCKLSGYTCKPIIPHWKSIGSLWKC